VLRSLFTTIGQRIGTYRNFPRIVGESGGKDFVLAHESADVPRLTTGLVRGAFEYQGQKCSAASRAYIPSTLWPELSERLVETTKSLQVGDVADLSAFAGAVISEDAFRRHEQVLAAVADDSDLEVLVGGGVDATDGWFVDPTVLVTTDPHHELLGRELFGPIVTVYVYDPARWDEALELVDTTSPYALTGGVFAGDRSVLSQATERLRQAAGNFYLNDKPTGSVVGQQPFGGARLSGTNDKAGSAQNLWRWVSTRSIKETFDGATDHRYPSMLPDEDPTV
jgi:1-pyrroline-5-carboxylate dehydrogenase